MSKEQRKRKMVIRTIREYLEHRHLPSIDIIENHIDTVKKVLERKIQEYESASTTIGQRIVKAEMYGVERLLSELETERVIKNNVCLPLSLIRNIGLDEDISTPQMVKLIIKTYLNLQVEEDDSRRKEVLVGFRLSASKDILRYSQGREKMSQNKADSIATTIADCYFETNYEKSNSRKYNNRKFLSSPFGGYIK